MRQQGLVAPTVEPSGSSQIVRIGLPSTFMGLS
jgi:hypothetical protein